MDLNYIEQLLILVSAIAGSGVFFTFALLAVIVIGIASSIGGLKISAISAWIKI